MAEYIFRDFLFKKKENDIYCESAGICAKSGEKASENAVLALKDLHLDLTKHRSRNILEINLKNYDVFAVMNVDHLTVLNDLAINTDKIYVLNKKNGGIVDPFGGNIKVYKKTVEDLISSFDDFYKFIKKINILKNASLTLAKPCDVENIYAIEQESYSDPWSKSSILSEILNKYTYFVILKQNDILLGYACIRLNIDEAEIFKLTTNPRFRKMGIAKILLQNLVYFAKKNGLKKILLEVRESNLSAIKLYKYFDFKKIFVRKNFYSSPLEDALTMQKDL